jgi:hypothetical protein
LFADVQKSLQISIFALETFRECSPLFAWVAARLLHAEAVSAAGLRKPEVSCVPLFEQEG